MRRFIAIAIASALAAPAQSQSLLDAGLRVGPQFIQYDMGGQIRQRISELAMPMFASVSLTPRLAIDVGTAFASARVESTDGRAATSTISGLTDTQLRASYTIGSDAVVVTGGLNLPTGRSTATLDELEAASLIGSDFLAFPVTNMGTGFGATGGVALARQAGSWNVGGGASLRRSSAYDALEDRQTSTRLRYQPGNEYRARVGADRIVGTGRMTLGLTFSTFGQDLVDSSVYNTGDRWIAQASYGGPVGPGDLTVAAFDLLRASGKLADGTATGRDQITNVFVSYGVRPGGRLIEPSVEMRNWFAQGADMSSLVTFGVRTQVAMGIFALTPSVRYGLGAIATGTSTASLSGWHALLSFGYSR